MPCRSGSRSSSYKITALADFIRTVFNTSQSAAPQLAPAHLGYRVHVHMEKNKAGCLLHGDAASWMLPAGCCQLCTQAPAPAQTESRKGARRSSARSLKTLEGQCLLGHSLHDAVTRWYCGLQYTRIADSAGRVVPTKVLSTAAELCVPTPHTSLGTRL